MVLRRRSLKGWAPPLSNRLDPSGVSKLSSKKMTRTLFPLFKLYFKMQRSSKSTTCQVRDWLMKLRDAVFDADDLLSDFSTHVLRQRVMGGDKMPKKVCIFFSSSNQLAFGLKMARKIKAMRERLNDIANDRNNFQLVGRSLETPVVIRGRGQTHSYVPEEEVIGREKDKEAIIDLLLDFDLEENVSFISIVGIGGLGKTTLAQYVYNDEKVKTYFELKMWVCVSDVFDIKTIAEKIIGSATGGSKGSKVMITTRTKLVAEISSTVSPYFLKAQGFIQSPLEENLQLEDVANEYFMDLHWRSFFQEAEEDRGVIMSVKMHDLIHDLAQSVSRIECTLVDSNAKNVNDKVRHLSFPFYNVSFFGENLSLLVKANKIRTFILTWEPYWPSNRDAAVEESTLKTLIFTFRYLRALDLHGLNIKTVPNIIEDPTASSKHCGGLAELNKLDLRGELEITNLAWVKDATSETKAANLKEKKHLNKLVLRWNPRDDDDLDAREDEISLNGLQPHQSLKYLRSARSGSRLFNCPNLKGWWKRDIVDNSDVGTASTCQQHISLPSFPRLSRLEISRIAVSLLACRCFHILKKAFSEQCQLEAIATDNGDDDEYGRNFFTSLLLLPSSLQIKDSISECPTLTSLSRFMQHLTSLKTLSISYCEEVDLFSDVDDGSESQRPTSTCLQSLTFGNISKLEALPAYLQHVTTLQYLEISKCPSFTTLPEWLGNLTSLHSLVIKECPNLTSLPEGMRHLSSLQSLRITNCPHLEQRCQKEIGEDWPKIAHVPKYTNSPKIYQI
uniref:NB-ARC domain-containing protein n=1 Tax=Fagus sylvatica TaxID=28930 RepID=A0A2N9FIE2_FAGSY